MVTKGYQNLKFQKPYQQAMYYCSLVLQDRTWPWMEQVEILPGLEADDLAKFVRFMLSRAFLECYIAGFHMLTFHSKLFSHTDLSVFLELPITIFFFFLFPSRKRGTQ